MEIELVKIYEGLVEIKKEWDVDKFVCYLNDEDIYIVNERCFGELIGCDIVGKVYIGRFCND